MALEIWDAAAPVVGTIADIYLSSRVGRVLKWPDDVRFHANCPRGNHKIPAVVALLRDIRTDEPRAVQRIFLRDDGKDRLRDTMGKATLGPAAGCAVKLAADSDVTYGLGICEGVETSLSLMAIGWSPIWCTAGTSGMAAFPMLGGVDTLTIFADADNAGRKAAENCNDRYQASGIQSIVRVPHSAGADWADVLRGDP